MAGEVIHRHKGFESCVYGIIKFPMATEFFSSFIIGQASNRSMLSLRLASTTAHLKPYPFGLRIEEQIPVLSGRMQVPVPALCLHLQ